MIAEQLITAGIRPTAQRLAIAEFVLRSTAHPSADEVFDAVNEKFPTISTATVYNTLKLFTEKQLLKQLHLRDDRIIYDPNVTRHHHFVDVETGEIHDIEWGAIDVCRIQELSNLDVEDYEVVLRGRRRESE
jgi:Fur family transcriptional regulator, iron response regulator